MYFRYSSPCCGSSLLRFFFLEMHTVVFHSKLFHQHNRMCSKCQRTMSMYVFLCRDWLEHLIFLPMRNVSKFIEAVTIPCAQGKPRILPHHRPHISSLTFHLNVFLSISLSPISSISHSFTLFYRICSELTVPMLSARFTGLRGCRCHVIQSKRWLLVSYQPWSLLSADCIIAFEYLEITSLRKIQPA